MYSYLHVRYIFLWPIFLITSALEAILSRLTTSQPTRPAQAQRTRPAKVGWSWYCETCETQRGLQLVHQKPMSVLKTSKLYSYVYIYICIFIYIYIMGIFFYGVMNLLNAQVILEPTPQKKCSFSHSPPTTILQKTHKARKVCVWNLRYTPQNWRLVHLKKAPNWKKKQLTWTKPPGIHSPKTNGSHL